MNFDKTKINFLNFLVDKVMKFTFVRKSILSM
jgi:hypothetical protein